MQPTSVTRPACLGGLLPALTSVGLLLTATTIVPMRPHTRTNLFVGLLALAVLVYLITVRHVLRESLPTHAVCIMLAVGVLARAMLLPTPPFLSSDIYRYVWDGKVQRAGINRYRFVPSDPSLSRLRDTTIFPHINLATYARTIYPTVAQIRFALVGRVSGTLQAMKIAKVGLELIGPLCMLRLLTMAGLPRERILIQLWNPLVIRSFACDGHVDAAAGLIGLALLASLRRRDGWAGGLLAAAALVKFLPLALAPTFVRGGTLWRPALAGLGGVVAGYACYASGGRDVLGFLPSYGSEEGLADGNGFWLLAGLAHLGRLPVWSGQLYIAVGAAGLGLPAIRIARGRWLNCANRSSDEIVLLCRDTTFLGAVATVAIGLHYSWYFASPALPCVVAPVPAVIWLSSVPALLTLDPMNERFVWPSLIHIPALVLLVVAMRRHRPEQYELAMPCKGTR